MIPFEACRGNLVVFEGGHAEHIASPGAKRIVLHRGLDLGLP